MARAKQGGAKRDKPSEKEEYVNFHDDTEDGFVSARESTVVSVPNRPKGRGKRSVEDMLLSQPNKAAQAAYVMERIAALEDQIARILALCPPEARKIVLEQRTSLRRYAPEEE